MSETDVRSVKASGARDGGEPGRGRSAHRVRLYPDVNSPKESFQASFPSFSGEPLM